MKDYLFEKLYRKVDDYFLRGKRWFDQFFILIEKFDRDNDEFYYVEVDRLFIETDEEINKVLRFFHSDKARGDLTDPCHHTSIIYKKFKTNSLKVEDFKLVDLKDYFEKVKARQDDFVKNKKLLLQLKINQYKLKNIFYYSFPLIGFNKLQGSIHILFDADDRKSTELKISAIFRHSIVVFTEFFESLYLNNSKNHEELDYRLLSQEALSNSFLAELDYPRFYLSRALNEEKNNLNTAFIDKPLVDIKFDFNLITELITKGETAKALDTLEEMSLGSNKEMYITILNFKARLALLNKDMVNGLLSSENFRNEINKLNYTILTMIVNLKD